MPHSHCTREIACDHRDFSQSFWHKRCACAGKAFNMWIGAYSTACPSEGMAMKKSSFLVLCMILLNGLGCSLVPNNGIGSGSARLAGRSRGPDFVTLVKQLQPAVVNVSGTMLPV